MGGQDLLVRLVRRDEERCVELGERRPKARPARFFGLEAREEHPCSSLAEKPPPGAQ